MKLLSFRKFFPITRTKTYLNHASTGPLPLTAARAIEQVVQKYLYQADLPIDILWNEFEETRRIVAHFIGASKDEIAFVKNTSQGILIAMNSIPFKKGDQVIILTDAFPANLYPFYYLWPEVVKKFLKTGDGADFLNRLKRLVNKKTRAISIDWVNWLSGVKLDLEEIGDFCVRHNIYLIVDAIQGLGALEIDLKRLNIDFLTCGSSKWLCGPQGIGILYVNKRRLDELVLTNIGWLSAEIESFHKFIPLGPPKRTAARFEEGTKNLIGICGLKESIRILKRAGIKNIEKQIFDLTDRLLNHAREKKCEILSPFAKSLRSGIVSIRPRNMDVENVYHQLKREKIVVSLREGWLRISPHFYNTESEIKKILNYF